VARGGTTSFVVAVDNDGPQPEVFTVRGQGSSPQFTITYWKGARNVTASVRNGTYTTAQLAPGGRSLLRVQMKAKSTSGPNARVTATVTARSTTLSTARDVVKVTAQR
jgi:hypothetical protein